MLELEKTSDGDRGEGISRTRESGFLISEKRRWRDEMLTASGAQTKKLRCFFWEDDNGHLSDYRDHT